MVYNKLKRWLIFALAVVSVVWFSIKLIFDVIDMITTIQRMIQHTSGEYFISVYNIGIEIALIAIWATLIKNPYKNNYTEYVKHKKKSIASIVLVSLLLLGFISMILRGWQLSALGIVYIIFNLLILGGIIWEMTLHPFVENKTQEQSKIQNEIDGGLNGKVKELKNLQRLGIITQEQVKVAVLKLVKDYIK